MIRLGHTGVFGIPRSVYITNTICIYSPGLSLEAKFAAGDGLGVSCEEISDVQTVSHNAGVEMSSQFPDVDTIGAAFATAALDPARWNEAMDVAAAATGSFHAIMLPLKGRLPFFPLSRDSYGLAEKYVNDGWINRDERYKSVGTMLRRGVSTEFDFTSADEMKRMPFYEEFLARESLRWFAGVKIGEGDDAWCLSLQRSIEQGPYQRDEIEVLATLSQQLSGIPQLVRAFGYTRVDAALYGFETSGAPAAILDRLGCVVRMNGLAERLLGPDLDVTQGRLVASNRQATNALDRAIRELLWRPDGSSVQPPVILPRRQGRPIVAYLSRLPGSVFDIFSPGRACIVFADLEAGPSVATDDLVAVFGLTRSEAKLAAQLLIDDSLERAAESLGIAYETARNQLKSVFRKTDTNRQAQLVAVLTRLRSLSP